ncbi:hypothetical protein O0I10_011479 [Lichtheimia ornata]|uniref:Uncharacterized protein n=1 Tax=Lichtheimia ornata TaxID=688661 RepID=A0AAD7XQG1_9FUNG|nr:uncharacterized protein O0I10_011479 [Lichtheimia ornata]KAJ8652879.1 hypothetical protein O0I10_011479 [Lichtheimia ornata]
MNIKLSLFITLIIPALTVLAAAPSQQPDPQGDGHQASGLDGVQASPGNGQTLSPEEMKEQCFGYCQVADEELLYACLGSCKFNMERCNKPECN